VQPSQSERVVLALKNHVQLILNHQAVVITRHPNKHSLKEGAFLKGWGHSHD
jgi:hypothetical protein